MNTLKTLKLVALDIDGVLLPDTFSPLIYKMIKDWGAEYTEDIEKNVFSRNRRKAAEYLIDKLKLKINAEELIKEYFKIREEYLQQNPMKPIDGLENFLEILKNMKLKIIAYGGLDRNHFFKELDGFTDFFDDEKYICTNEFRPGIKEITTEIYNYKYQEVLFVDDVCNVAEEARNLGVPFIGVPANNGFGFQKKNMKNAGVKFIVESIQNINEKLLRSIDSDAKLSQVWG